jgi:hypothetical protein
MNPLEFIIVLCATWRLAYLAVKESGPFAFMEKIRAWNNFGGMLDCVYCASIWSAALVVFLWQFKNLHRPIIAVGASGAALLVQRYAGMDY